MNKEQARVLFMGTPDIAKACLMQLVVDGYNVVGVFTREDKPFGRKQIITPPPVKIYAQENNIPVFQPKSLKDNEIKIISQLAPDIIIVVAYGRILPKAIIDIPQYGCVNLHVSLLPKYRGAAPIQWAIINGEVKTGVTVMYIDEGLDTGDIIDVLDIDILPQESSGELFLKVTEQGKRFLSHVCEKILLGTAKRTPQNHKEATLAPMLTKDMALFDFNGDTQIIHNKIRGQTPWPGAYFIYDGKKVKVQKAAPSNLQGSAGCILSIKPFIVATKDYAIEIITVSPEGSKPMDGTAYCLGKRFKVFDSLV